MLFHQDSVRVHTCVVAVVKFHELGPHPLYCMNFGLNYHFQFFSNLKKWLRGKRFGSIDDITAQANAYLKTSDNFSIWKWTKIGESVEEVYVRSKETTFKIKHFYYRKNYFIKKLTNLLTQQWSVTFIFTFLKRLSKEYFSILHDNASTD